LLSRLASKRKSRNITKDEANQATAGTATGVAAGTTAVVADDTIDTTKSTGTPTRSSVEDAEVVGAPISPVRTKDSSSQRIKPNLERHITNIETSSESESDNEEDRLRKREKKQKSALLASAAPDRTDDDEDFVDPNEAFATPVRTRSIGDAPPTSSTTATKSSGELPNDNSSTVATKSIAERVLASPIDAPRALAEPPFDNAPVAAVPVEAPRESTASSRPDVEKETAQDSKRSRGFFSRFRNRQSKAEREPGSFSGASGKPTTTTATPATAAAAVTSSSDPRGVSPSSFTRRRSTDDDAAASRKSSIDLSDVSSLSSGLDEDDLQNGRTGRMARAEKTKTTDVVGTDGLATTNATAAATTTGKGVRSDDDDSDQFEEARDHFDEGLAPQPSFGGQAKSASPARETRFKEEV
jgi:hypothetical protein